MQIAEFVGPVPSPSDFFNNLQAPETGFQNAANTRSPPR
jgi:hypothetical protein